MPNSVCKHSITAALVLIAACTTLFDANTSHAGDRLLATGGVSQIEGAGGGGLVPWALISGYGTDKQTGGALYYTKARTRGGYSLDVAGVSVGFYNRFELALSQQSFGLSDTIPDKTIRVNILGAKLRLLGDTVYDQDTWLPQVAVGFNYKQNEEASLVTQGLAAKHATGADFYVAATKLYLDALWGRNILLGTTLIATKANQFGLLGFGGDINNHYQLQPSASVAIMLDDNLLLGTEYRAKPNNLSAFKEEDAKDIFMAWFPVRNFSITGAYIDLGNIANKENQTGWYVSGQLAY